MADDDSSVAALFVAALPLVLRNAGAVRVLGAEPAWAPSFSSDDVAPGFRYAVLSASLRAARDAATAARACARVARVCAGARAAALAEAPRLPPGGTERLAARARAARRIGDAIAQLRLLPRPAAQLVSMLADDESSEGGTA